MDIDPSRTVYLFGRFILDLDRGALFLEGEQIDLRPKSFGMLRFFVDNPGRLLDRDTIMEAIWPGTTIAEEGVIQCVRDIRRALGDEARSVLKTVPKRGYIFTAAVSGRGTPLSTEGSHISNVRPVVVVLPFRSSTTSEMYLAAGLTDELVTSLARFRSLSVICPGENRRPRLSLVIDGAGPTGFGRGLGAEYLLEGRVKSSGRPVRVNARLVSPATETVLWSDRYEGDVTEPFRIQDIAADSVTVAVETHIITAEIDRAMRSDISKLDAHGLFLRALRNIWKQTVSSTSEAVALLRRAVAIDPGYAPALGMLGMCLQQQITQGWRPPHPCGRGGNGAYPPSACR
jgi:adenylate cyclase